MPDARVEVTDALGRRIVPIRKDVVGIGLRETNDLRLAGSEVSRDHAEIVSANGSFLIRDKHSRYGTFVNDDPVTDQHALAHGDRIRLGRSGDAELVFLTADTPPPQDKSTRVANRDLRTAFEGLRALGSGRGLDDVLAFVLDSAIEVSGAERGFIMLANAQGGELEFKMARDNRQQALSSTSFATSRKIPEKVFRSGAPRLLAEALFEEVRPPLSTGTFTLGIRTVLCVPLKLVRFVDPAAAPEKKRIGVLYLDSWKKGSFLSTSTRSSLETLANEAAIAIENARLLSRDEFLRDSQILRF